VLTHWFHLCQFGLRESFRRCSCVLICSLTGSFLSLAVVYSAPGFLLSKMCCRSFGASRLEGAGATMKKTTRNLLLNPCFLASSPVPAGSHHRRKPTVQGSGKAPEANQPFLFESKTTLLLFQTSVCLLSSVVLLVPY
jgi:hypothetical protein